MMDHVKSDRGRPMMKHLAGENNAYFVVLWQFLTPGTQRDPAILVQTIPIRNTFVEQCYNQADSWGSQVQTRLEVCIDLVAAEGRYHLLCYQTCMLTLPTSKPVGRPVPGEMHDWFEALCKWLQNDCEAELCTLDELHAHMVEIAGGDEAYSMKRLKQKLQEHYGDHVYFAEIRGKKNVVCFRNVAGFIINDKWYSE